MKKMKSFIIAALAVAFMFVFAGCSKESDKFIGKWKTTLDFSKEVTDAMKMELIGKLREEGNFKVKDGKIFFSEGKDNEIDVNVYNTYEFTDDGKLKILEEVNPADEDNEFSEILPLTFEKIS